MLIQSRERHAELIAEYEKLCACEGITPQVRGQRFNGFVSELLTSYGLRARPNNTGHGEIDVAFQLDGSRFVLEAKWEQKPIDEDPILKIRDRVTKRLAGTVGVLLSMSGYTEPAIEEMTRGQRLEVLLIDRSHLEAMLYQFLSPREIFSAVLDNAHFHGEPRTRIEDFRKRTHSQINIEWSWDIPDGEIQTPPGYSAVPLFRTDQAGFNQLYEQKTGEFFFTHRDGIVRVEQVHISAHRDRSFQFNVTAHFG